jgi:hypothetical protein
MCSKAPTTGAILRLEIKNMLCVCDLKICCVFVQWSPIMTELGIVLSVAECCETFLECVKNG